jgi:hypothetical protein
VTRPTRRSPKIKTIGQIGTGRTRTTERHVHQFKIASLELERTRRSKDLANALARVAEISKRLGEIEAEMEQHRVAMPPLAALPENRKVDVTLANTGTTARPDAARTNAAQAGASSSKRRTLRY